MAIIFIIAGAIFVYYLFSNDQKDLKIKVLQNGGLKRIYPNFVNYIEMANAGSFSHDLSLDATRFELVKDDGEYLEYKFPIYSFNRHLSGYYYIGIQHSFGTFAYCYCKNSQGKKVEGYISELHNGRNTSIPRDRDVDNYRSIFSNLIMSMEAKPNFDNIFYNNL